MGRTPCNADDPVVRIVEAAVAAVFAANAEMMRPMLREFALDLCQRWHEHYAGQRVPKNTRLWRIERDEKIVAANHAGRIVVDLAQDFHLSEAWITRILEKRREPY